MKQLLRAGLAALAFAALAAPALAVPHAGDAAPPFAIGKLGGGKIALANFRGKPLYVNFFASWCGPCNVEAPAIGRLYRRYHARGLQVLGVDELEEPGPAKEFARKYGWPFPIGLDADGSMGHDYGTIYLPVQVFIDKSGKVSTYRIGPMEPGDVEDAIKKIL
jgi:peroxiredoxin